MVVTQSRQPCKLCGWAGEGEVSEDVDTLIAIFHIAHKHEQLFIEEAGITPGEWMSEQRLADDYNFFVEAWDKEAARSSLFLELAELNARRTLLYERLRDLI